MNISKELRSQYAKAASSYDISRYGFEKGKLFKELGDSLVLEFIGNDNQKRLLDFATGTGRIALSLAKRGFQVFAIDITPEMLELAIKKATEQGLQGIFWSISDGMALPFPDNTFDYVVATKFFHLLSSRFHNRFIDECLRVLKPGGTLIADFNNAFFWIGLLVFGKKEWRGYSKFFWPHQRFTLYGKYNIVRMCGEWAPFSGFLFRVSKRMFKKFNNLIKHFPFYYFASKLFILFEKR